MFHFLCPVKEEPSAVFKVYCLDIGLSNSVIVHKLSQVIRRGVASKHRTDECHLRLQMVDAA